MPINPNIPASEYTQYLRERSTIVSRKWVPPDFSNMFYNSQIFHARIVRKLIHPVSISISDIAPIVPPAPLDYGFITFLVSTIRIAPKPSLDFGSGDFTIEWYMLTSNIGTGSSADVVFSFSNGTTELLTVFNFVGYLHVTNTFRNTSYDISSTSFSLNVWNHWVVQVINGIVQVRKNGQVVGGAPFTVMPNGCFFMIGGHPYLERSYPLRYSSISNFRITKGTALYATSYTRPTLPLSGTGSSLLLLATADNPFGDSSVDSANSVITLPGYLPPTRNPGPITPA